MKRKTTKTLILLLIIIMLFSTFSLAKDKEETSSDLDFKTMIKSEEGSLFEKIIAETIGGIAQTVYSFATSDNVGMGFKNYDKLIFNSNLENDSLSPFSVSIWNKVLNWYKIFSIISGSLIFIGVIILSYKLIMAGVNISQKNEVKDSLLRLVFGGIAIAIGPLFIRFLLFLNNSLVHILVNISNGGLDGLLGNEMLSSVRTGNAITTAIVISMFIYLFVKLNIKFIIREFTLIVFTIFTPIAAGLWIINKNVTAAAIWSGQILINVFMQFVYSFLFLLYLSFLPSSAGWAVSLVWAMMILPLADTLINCLQNLTSRIAGLDNSDMSARAMGMGVAFGSSLNAIKNQFSSNNSQNNISSGNSFSNLFGKVKNVVSPNMNLSSEKDYNGNINPIRNVIPKEKENNSIIQKDKNTKMVKALKTGAKATSAYLGIGSKMAEGTFIKTKSNNNNFINTEYNNNLIKNKNNKDDKNE